MCPGTELMKPINKLAWIQAVKQNILKNLILCLSNLWIQIGHTTLYCCKSHTKCPTSNFNFLRHWVPNLLLHIADSYTVKIWSTFISYQPKVWSLWYNHGVCWFSSLSLACPIILMVVWLTEMLALAFHCVSFEIALCFESVPVTIIVFYIMTFLKTRENIFMPVPLSSLC